MARGKDVLAPEATISYAHNLFELQEREGGGKGYGCTLVWPKTVNLTALKEAVLEIAVEEGGAKAKDMIANEAIKIPYLDGDGKQGLSKTGERKKELAGCWFVRPTSGADYQPKVFDRRKIPIFEKSEVPSGSKVLAVLNPFTWENPKNGKGISFGISLVQVTRKATGDEILGGSGGPDPDKFFDKIEDEGDAPESTKGGQGAAALFG